MTNRFLPLLLLISFALAAVLAACQPAAAPTPTPTPGAISISLRLVSAAGVTFPPVHLRLIDVTQDPNSPQALVGEAETDAQGSYRFEGLPPGAYGLGFNAPMPDGIQCSGPSMLQVDNWMVIAGYSSTDQGQRMRALDGLYDAPLQLEPGAELHLDLEMPVTCQP